MNDPFDALCQIASFGLAGLYYGSKVLFGLLLLVTLLT